MKASDLGQRRIKEYQSDRNQYTKQLFPAVGNAQHDCGDNHWWDVKGRCVFCGIEKPIDWATAGKEAQAMDLRP